MLRIIKANWAHVFVMFINITELRPNDHYRGIIADITEYPRNWSSRCSGFSALFSVFNIKEYALLLLENEPLLETL